MEPGPLVFSLLSQAAPVAALLGYAEGPATKYRIYPLVAPQGVPRPYVLYQVISRVPQGSARCQLGDAARVQLSIFTDSYDQGIALAAACREALHYAAADGAYLEIANDIDQHDPAAACFFRSQDYSVELP